MFRRVAFLAFSDGLEIVELFCADADGAESRNHIIVLQCPVGLAAAVGTHTRRPLCSLVTGRDTC